VYLRIGNPQNIPTIRKAAPTRSRRSMSLIVLGSILCIFSRQENGQGLSFVSLVDGRKKISLGKPFNDFLVNAPTI
jgi:hypothetical protein